MSSSKHQNQPSKQKPTNKAKKLIFKPIPLYILLLMLVPFLSLGLIMEYPKKTKPVATEEAKQNKDLETCAKIVREQDTGLIRPLLLVETYNDEGSLMSLKKNITTYIKKKQQENALISASVYIKSFNESPNHLEINSEELYDPASLMKVPMLIIYLKEIENNPSILKNKLFFKGNGKEYYDATIKDKTITPGKSYTVENLLYNMIVYSDNEAFWLLAAQSEGAAFEKLNSDFEIPINTDHKNRGEKGENFIANVNSISRFFRVLYNASYLEKKWSKFALNLLTKSTYKDGLLKGIDPSVKVAHKFGERFEDGVAQLHEFGIVYLKNHNPYLIGVMTKGPDKTKLPGILSEISKMTYDEMTSK